MSFIGNVPAEAYSPVAKDTFSGNSSTTDFTLSIPANTNSVNVYVENVAQEPTTAYTISGTTLSFTAAPVTGTNNIYVIHRGPAVQQIVPPAGVALNPSTVDATGDISTDTGVNTDTISEKTSASGVTIDGVLLKDGEVTVTDKIIHAGDTNTAIRFPAADTIAFETGGSERARIDSSGNLLVGKTTDAFGTAGTYIGSSGLQVTRAAGSSVFLNRISSDGAIISLYKDGATVGSIGVNSSNAYFAGTVSGIRCYNSGTLPTDGSGVNSDNTKDLGDPSVRWDDVYATNGTIQTSDRNEKQDIETLSEAEQRVAVAAKSLMRKFRWKSAVEKKGDDARIHFGIIAQDLQAAFEAEGLDAGRYAMFIYSEWWETYTDVPAVEAVDAVYETVTDEEGNETQVLVSEAVEAKEAYTRTDTYDTEEEAPEGAVKKSRMGVRYSELLAFIIGAL